MSVTFKMGSYGWFTAGTIGCGCSYTGISGEGSWDYCDKHKGRAMDELIWEFYEDSKGEYRWRAKDAHNGNVLFISAEGYNDKRDAVKCANRAGFEGMASWTHELPTSSR